MKIKKLELHFSPIDGKDQGPICAAYDYMLTKEHNMLVMARAEDEYLTRLAALHKELKEKYDNQFQDETEEDIAAWENKHWEEQMDIENRIREEARCGASPLDCGTKKDLFYT